MFNKFSPRLLTDIEKIIYDFSTLKSLLKIIISFRRRNLNNIYELNKK